MSKTPLEKLIVDETKSTNRAQLNEYKLHKFKEIINYSKENSVFYREKFKDVDTDKINNLNDLNTVPYTYPEELVKDPYKFLCVPQKYIKRVVTLKTSGTTGQEGKRIFFTEDDLNLTVNFFYHGFMHMVNEGDRVMIMMPGETYGSVGDIIKKSLTKLKVESFVYGTLKDLDDAGKFIEQNKINAIVALPMQAMYLSLVKEDIFKKNIEKLMLSADYVPEVLIKELKMKFNCKVFTHYGLTETGYGLAVECEELDGYHVRENDVYLEIIDPKTGIPIDDGKLGEIVLTTFNRQAMPIIRYRTGDYGVYKLKQCSCGTFLKTLERSKGRINNTIKIKNEHIHMSELDEIFFQHRGILDYSLNVTDEMVNIKIFSLYELGEKKEKLINSIEEILNKNNDLKVKIVFEKIQNISFSPNTMIKRTLYTNS